MMRPGIRGQVIFVPLVSAGVIAAVTGELVA